MDADDGAGPGHVPPEAVADQLRAALASKDPDRVEAAVTAAHRAGLHEALVPVLVELLAVDWHRRHEDIVLALQRVGDARAVSVLTETATKRFDYLAFDGGGDALARKCTWALADIGTEEARRALHQLAESDRSPLAGAAQKRLDAWDDEQPRKRASRP